MEIKTILQHFKRVFFFLGEKRESASNVDEEAPMKQLATVDFKSKLNEYTQRNRLVAPMYETGPAPGGFITTLTFDGVEFKSFKVMTKKKPAEQSAAHVACYYYGLVDIRPGVSDSKDFRAIIRKKEDLSVDSGAVQGEGTKKSSEGKSVKED